MIRNSIIIFVNTFILLFIICVFFYIYGDSGEKYGIQKTWGISPSERSNVKFRKLTDAEESTYTLTELYQREVYQKSDNSKIKKFLILSGGSNTFGQNLSLKSTLSNQVQADPKFNSLQAYNMSFPGWSVANVLAYVNSEQFEIPINEKQGVFVFYFDPYQMERVCGSDNYWDWSGGVAPRFKLLNDKVARSGFHNESLGYHWYLVKKGFRKVFSKLMVKKISRNGADLLMKNKECTSLVVGLFVALKNKLSLKLPSVEFVISIIPEFKHQTGLSSKEEQFYGELERKKIKVFKDVSIFRSKYEKYFNGKSMIFSDGHSNRDAIYLRKEVLYLELVKNDLL